VVSISYCDYVVLDKKWARHKLESEDTAAKAASYMRVSKADGSQTVVKQSR